jgi:hypothetical protein
MPLARTERPAACLAVGIEHALEVAVQRPHDADPRQHVVSTVLGMRRGNGEFDVFTGR